MNQNQTKLADRDLDTNIERVRAKCIEASESQEVKNLTSFYFQGLISLRAFIEKMEVIKQEARKLPYRL